MAAGFSFEVRQTCGAARRGVLTTPHGPVETPAFMPVGTRAAVKGVTPAQLAEAGAPLVLANTYHLMLRPGAEVVQQLGGLHAFMGWDGPILTDSGGFQVFSLADLRQMDDDGVVFRSHIDGALVRLTPERSIELQNQLGADIIMAFDECPALGEKNRGNVGTWERGNGGAPNTTLQESIVERGRIERAVRRTAAWARRSKMAHRRDDQALYGIVQGGLDVELRRDCLRQLLEIGFDGYALGGLSVGEPPEEMYALLNAFAHELPADQPRYLMGVGTPRDLVNAVAAGIDQFDCVLPTRNGRKGYAFTSVGVLRLRNARHRVSSEPLDPACDCYACRRFCRGYLRHLFMNDEVLGATLVSLHNIRFYQSLMRRMREEIGAGTFDAWRRSFAPPAATDPGEDDEE